jgi:AraC-like DNA-binding protein
MTIPRRHHRANQPARQPKEPASSTQENIERHRPSYSPARADQVSRQQLTELEKQLFNRPLVELAAKLGEDARLARTWSLIETRYADSDLRLDLAARESGVSRDHLNEILSQTIGLTFHQTLIRYRLLKAVTIMRARNCTALDVALDAGFGSVSAFERTFKRVLGMGPKQFRDAWRLR